MLIVQHFKIHKNFRQIFRLFSHLYARSSKKINQKKIKNENSKIFYETIYLLIIFFF